MCPPSPRFRARNHHSVARKRPPHVLPIRTEPKDDSRGGTAKTPRMSESWKVTIMCGSLRHSVSVGADHRAGRARGVTMPGPLPSDGRCSGQPPPALTKNPPPLPSPLEAIRCTQIPKALAHRTHHSSVSLTHSALVMTPAAARPPHPHTRTPVRFAHCGYGMNRISIAALPMLRRSVTPCATGGARRQENPY